MASESPSDLKRIILLLVLVASSYAQQAGQWMPGFATGACVLETDPSNPSMYRVYVPNRGYMSFSCAPGTVFYLQRCGCDWPTGPIQPGGGGNILPTRPGNVLPTRPPVTRPSGIGPTIRPPIFFTTFAPPTFRPPIQPTFPPGGGIIGPTLGPPSWSTQAPLPTSPAPCTLRPDPDRNYYDEYIYGFGWQKRRCPIGTLYNHTVCACHDLSPVSMLECHPELYLTFDQKEIKDDAGSNIPIGNNGNVASVSNAGRFDGTGTLTIWRYSNTDLGRQLTINLRFYNFPGGSEEQIILSNCYMQDPGSIEIAINQATKDVIFRADTLISGPQEIRIPFQEQAWKNITMEYDGSNLRARVGPDEKMIPMKGNIEARYNGLLVGSCNGRGFVGYIDELRLYRCIPAGRNVNRPIGNLLSHLSG